LKAPVWIKLKKGLEADGILTGAGKKRWHTSTIRKILSNEKYIGDALLQKTYTVDFLTKKRVVNNGIVPQYYVENSHEAIIPREIFMQVQEELVRRSKGHISTSGKRKETLVQIMYFHKLFSVESVVKYAVEFIGITEAKNRLFGDVSVGLRIQG